MAKRTKAPKNRRVATFLGTINGHETYLVAIATNKGVVFTATPAIGPHAATRAALEAHHHRHRNEHGAALNATALTEREALAMFAASRLDRVAKDDDLKKDVQIRNAVARRKTKRRTATLGPASV